MGVWPAVVVGSGGVAGRPIIGGFAIGRRVPPIGQAVCLARIYIAANFILGTTGESDRQGGGTYQHQRHVATGFSDALQHFRAFEMRESVILAQAFPNVLRLRKHSPVHRAVIELATIDAALAKAQVDMAGIQRTWIEGIRSHRKSPYRTIERNVHKIRCDLEKHGTQLGETAGDALRM